MDARLATRGPECGADAKFISTRRRVSYWKCQDCGFPFTAPSEEAGRNDDRVVDCVDALDLPDFAEQY